MTKKMIELRELQQDELLKLLEETKREMFNLRFQRETERTEKPAEIRAARKLVARINTLMKERQAEAAGNAGSSDT
jgi:large subunit ribosomal protein L29